VVQRAAPPSSIFFAFTGKSGLNALTEHPGDSKHRGREPLMRQIGFGSYQQFKKEILAQHAGPLCSSVEEIADDIYNTQVGDDFDSLWDAIDDDD
jgi:hypothetical protein